MAHLYESKIEQYKNPAGGSENLSLEANTLFAPLANPKGTPFHGKNVDLGKGNIYSSVHDGKGKNPQEAPVNTGLSPRDAKTLEVLGDLNKPNHPKHPVEKTKEVKQSKEHSDKATRENAAKILQQLNLGMQESNPKLGGAESKVANMKSAIGSEVLNDGVSALLKDPKGRAEMKSIFTGATNKAPCMLDTESAKVTRPYEERLSKILTGNEVVPGTNEKITGRVSQEEFAKILRGITPDKATAILVAANFTKDLTARSRYLEGTGTVTKEGQWISGGVSENALKHDKKMQEAFSDERVNTMVERLDTIDGSKRTDGQHTKNDWTSGKTYHFYGAAATTYFNNVVGTLGVHLNDRMEPEDIVANDSGSRIGAIISSTDSRHPKEKYTVSEWRANEKTRSH